MTSGGIAAPVHGILIAIARHHASIGHALTGPATDKFQPCRRQTALISGSVADFSLIERPARRLQILPSIGTMPERSPLTAWSLRRARAPNVLHAFSFSEKLKPPDAV